MKGVIPEYIRRLIRIYIISGVIDETTWNLFHDIIFLDPVTTRHISRFQPMWLHRRGWSSPFREWSAAFSSFMGHVFDKTRDQMNKWKRDKPHAFGDQVDRSTPQKTSSGKLNALAIISLGTVAIISGHDLPTKQPAVQARQLAGR
jgi:hypothetical protein